MGRVGGEGKGTAVIRPGGGSAVRVVGEQSSAPLLFTAEQSEVSFCFSSMCFVKGKT